MSVSGLAGEAHAARVLKPAARRIHFQLASYSPRARVEPKSSQSHERFGEPPKPARRRRALPTGSSGRGAHAARVLKPAARRIHFQLALYSPRARVEPKSSQSHERLGEPPKPTRRRRALPVGSPAFSTGRPRSYYCPLLSGLFRSEWAENTDQPIMSAERTCEECGADLPANAPQGLCPRCLPWPPSMSIKSEPSK